MCKRVPGFMLTTAHGESLQNSFPDQHCMFTRLVPAKLSRNIANLSCVDVCNETGYKGPPDLVSMFLCLCGAVEKTNTQFLINNMHELRGIRDEYKQK